MKSNEQKYAELVEGDFTVSPEAVKQIEDAIQSLGELCEAHGVPAFFIASLGRETTRTGENEVQVQHNLSSGQIFPKGRTPDELYAMKMIEKDGLVRGGMQVAAWAALKRMAGDDIVVEEHVEIAA